MISFTVKSKHLSIEPGCLQCTLIICSSFRQTEKCLFHLFKGLKISNLFQSK